MTNIHVLLFNGSCGCKPHLSSLHQAWEHNNHPTFPVSHHLPEVPGSRLHGTLSDDEGSMMLVTLWCIGYEILMVVLHNRVYWGTHMYIRGINVVWSFSFQNYTPSINCMYQHDEKRGLSFISLKHIHKMCPINILVLSKVCWVHSRLTWQEISRAILLGVLFGWNTLCIFRVEAYLVQYLVKYV